MDVCHLGSSFLSVVVCVVVIIDAHVHTSELERVRSPVSGGYSVWKLPFVVVCEEIMNVIGGDGESGLKDVVEVKQSESEVESGDSACGLADEVGVVVVQVLEPRREDVSIDEQSVIDS